MQRVIDAALDGGASVVRAVDGAGQFNEFVTEIAAPLTVPNIVLDFPQCFIDPA